MKRPLSLNVVLSITLFTLTSPLVIPSRVPRRHVPKAVRQQLESFSPRFRRNTTVIPDSLLYELSSDGLLIGPNTTINLKQSRRLSWPESPHGFTYTINGHKQSSRDLHAVHHVAGYDLMYDEHGDVTNLWGDKLFLEALSTASRPHIFINTYPHLEQRNQTTASPWEYQSHTQQQVKLSTRQRGSSCRVFRVAIAYDNSFCGRFQNKANKATAYVQTIIQRSNYYLRRDTCHQVRLVNVEAHCNDASDPYRYKAGISKLPASTMRANYILSRFQSLWLNRRKSVRRDAAYFFSGFADGTGVGGAAYLGAACTMFGFGWVELGIGPIFVHEMGHSIGAPHDDKGIMRSYLSPGPVFFSRGSAAQIDRFMKSDTARCMTTVRADEIDDD